MNLSFYLLNSLLLYIHITVAQYIHDNKKNKFSPFNIIPKECMINTQEPICILVTYLYLINNIVKYAHAPICMENIIFPNIDSNNVDAPVTLIAGSVGPILKIDTIDETIINTAPNNIEHSPST